MFPYKLQMVQRLHRGDKTKLLRFCYRGPQTYPSRDFFLWGHIKAEVYRSRVPALAALKQRIRAAIHGLSQEAVNAAVDNLALRARACVRLRGGYLETVLPH